MKRTVIQSSKDGRFVSREYADANPDTTFEQKVEVPDLVKPTHGHTIPTRAPDDGKQPARGSLGGPGWDGFGGGEEL